MTQPPQPLFEMSLLARRRDRAMRLGFAEGAHFLHLLAGDVVAERLGDVTRHFERAAVIGAADGAFLSRVGQEAVSYEPSALMARAAGGRVDACDVLPLAEGAHDLILSNLLLHWQNDPVGHLIQARRALAPDGLLIASAFAGQTLHELRAALAEAEVEVTGGLSPRVAPMAEIRDLGGLLQRAGLAMPVADIERQVVTYPSALHLMRDLRAMGETSILAARPRKPLRRDVLMRACEIYARHFPAEGGVRATFEIVFLTGWAPGPNQPVALRPGSARTRLAEALNTVEHDPEA